MGSRGENGFVRKAFVISAFAMLLLVFMTDFAKIALATDRVRWSRKPETWNIGGFIALSVVLGVAMVAKALLVLAVGWSRFGLAENDNSLHSFCFLTLLYFGVFSIVSARERHWFSATMSGKTLAADLLIATDLDGDESTPAARFDRLARYLDDFGLGRADLVALFAKLLFLSPDERYPTVDLTPVREREETFRVMRQWLTACSDRHPLLFVIEDLHWIDASTLEFLGQFIAEGLHDRILTVLTFRPEFTTPWPAVAHQSSLALTRLTRRQVGELMRKETGRPLPDSLVVQITSAQVECHFWSRNLRASSANLSLRMTFPPRCKASFLVGWIACRAIAKWLKWPLRWVANSTTILLPQC